MQVVTSSVPTASSTDWEAAAVALAYELVPEEAAIWRTSLEAERSGTPASSIPCSCASTGAAAGCANSGSASASASATAFAGCSQGFADERPSRESAAALLSDLEEVEADAVAVGEDASSSSPSLSMSSSGRERAARFSVSFLPTECKSVLCASELFGLISEEATGYSTDY